MSYSFQFNPKAGAIFGNTKLKIDGRDLGTTVGDVANVTVAGQSCQFLTHLYVPSKTYVVVIQIVYLDYVDS